MDHKLIKVAILVFLAEAIWLLAQMDIIDLGANRNLKEAIGNIFEQSKEVRVKRNGEITWESATQNQGLAAYDMVLTLRNSTAKIRLIDTTEIDLAENSMVLIEPPSPKFQLGLKLKRGSYIVKVAKPATIKIGNKSVKAPENAKIQVVQTDEGKIDIVSEQPIQVAEIPPEEIQEEIPMPEEPERELAAEPFVEPQPEPEVVAEEPPPPEPEAIPEPPPVVEEPKIVEAPKPPEKPKKIVMREPPREVQAVEEEPAQTTAPPPLMEKPNDPLPRDYFQLEGSGYGALSSINPRNTPQLLWATFGGRHFLSPTTYLDGRLGSKVMGANDLGTKVSPILVNSYFHKQWYWVNFLRGTLFSLYGGGEYYSNGQSGTTSQNIFVSQYVMAEFGTSLRFNLFENWDTGGAASYGYDLSGRGSKYQIQGDIFYRFQPDWSLGVGYRAKLYEALQTSGSPDGQLPYREGSLEAFGSLRYFLK